MRMKLGGTGNQADGKLPNLLIVGAAKSGTTSLHYYLRQHPEIYMSPVKEPKFITAQFVRFPLRGVGDDRTERQIVKDLRSYKALFAKAKREKVLGESSTDTMYYYDRSIPVIREILGQPKILIILRNPVERAFSNYLHLVRDGRETLSFEEALEQEESRIRDNWNYFWHYRSLGLYANQVKAFLEAFPATKVVLFDDLRKDLPGLLREIFTFLEVDPSFTVKIPSAPLNVSGVPKNKLFQAVLDGDNPFLRTVRRLLENTPLEDPLSRIMAKVRKMNLEKIKMDSRTRKSLIEFYEPDIRELSRIIDRDLSSWLN